MLMIGYLLTFTQSMTKIKKGFLPLDSEHKYMDKRRGFCE